MPFSKISGKLKKKQMTNNNAGNNNMGGIQSSCNTNPKRGDNTVNEKEREGSVDATSTYNIGNIRG